MQSIQLSQCKDSSKKNAHAASLQAQIDLGAHIDAIASNRRSSTQPDIKGIRNTRIKEQNKVRHQGGNANA